ncbi:hypothetical protein [Leptospira levettii]|uniref:hypothetical protein n=1 Tax=Leptospira levettii TaxID=2023178 RepID=UPI001082F76A|nr:hypothetical protein [Leptospira levettii]TGM31758.1 hypothetical protein EHQ71_07150 [Leptospira levettii]TGM85388.1 hypothetical protein EHR00_04835 [Leptospira levettii]
MIYFFAKVDNGNRLLEFAEELGGFYIGFFDDEKHVSNEILDFSLDTDFEIKLNNPDWQYLNLFSEERWRDKIRVITYDSHELKFWQVTGKVTKFNTVHSLESLPKKLIKAKQKNLKDFYLWNFLPVKLITAINRSLLPSSIDSLSVYQYLNRGTFRPMIRLADYKNKFEYPKIIEDDLFKFIVKTSKKAEETIIETKYSRILRFYFDAIFSKKEEYSTELRKTFSNLSNSEKNLILGVLFNPAQVETMAMLLIQDIGFTADIGIGKGLDFVDIKGSLRHRSEADIRGCLAKLSENNFIKINKSTFDKIIKEKTINIQCKAESYSDITNDLIYLLPESKHSELENIILIENIIEKMDNSNFNIDFPLLSDWLNLQKYNLGLN